MEGNCNLEELLREADTVVEKQRQKLQSNGIQHFPCNDNINANETLPFTFGTNGSFYQSTADTSGQLVISMNNDILCVENIGGLQLSAIESSIQNGVDSVREVNGYNKDCSSSSSELCFVEELRELCWFLLSTAQGSLREQSNLHRELHCKFIQLEGKKASEEENQLLTPRRKFNQILSAHQQKVADAAARIQYLLVEVQGVRQRNLESEQECVRLCSLLSSLLQSVTEIFNTAGMAHLALSSVITPRRSSVQRQVDSAVSALQTLQLKLQRDSELIKEQQNKIERFQHQIREAEEVAQDTISRCSSALSEQRESSHHSEQQLQQVYLQLARAEESLKLLQGELSSSSAASSEREQQQQNTIDQLRAALTTSEQKLQKCVDTTRDVQATLEHLQQESVGRVEQLTADLEEARSLRDQLQIASEREEKELQASLEAVRREREDALSNVAALNTQLQLANQKKKTLASQLQERISNQEEIDRELLVLRDQIHDSKISHEQEVATLHDKVSALGLEVCSSQQELRREQLLNLQLRTQLEFEQQRSHELKQHNAALLKQTESLQRSLREQINRRMEADVHNILSSASKSADIKRDLHVTNMSSESTNIAYFHDYDSPGNYLFENLAPRHWSNPEALDRRDVPFNNLSAQVQRLHCIEADVMMFASEKELASERARDEKDELEFSSGMLDTPIAETEPVVSSVTVTRPTSRRCLNFNSPSIRCKTTDEGRSPGTVRESSSNARHKGVSTSVTRQGVGDIVASRQGLIPTSASLQGLCLSSASRLGLCTSCPSLHERDSSYLSTAVSRGSLCDEMTGLRLAREEARIERIESARLKEKIALLQVELTSQKAALEDERAKMKAKSRIHRVKREEFGSLLGALEETVERSSLDPITSVDLEASALNSIHGTHYTSPRSSADCLYPATTGAPGDKVADREQVQEPAMMV